MNESTESFRRVQYDLRPAKQIERRMIVDALQLLAMEGFSIRDYQYTGMGSIYFVDFVLFHRLLGMERMVSVEQSPIQGRVAFNKPFRVVAVEMCPVGDYIPRLSRDLRHLLWLDYDSVLSTEHLEDVSLAGTYLTPGSILLVTVDSEPPVRVEAAGSPERWREYFMEVGKNYVDPAWESGLFAQSKLPFVNALILENALRAGLSGRRDVEFLPLFNFIYADGHRMVTIGGMVVSDVEKRRVLASRLPQAFYYRRRLEEPAYEIHVPKVTRKERFLLDSAMPCDEGWKPDSLDLPAEDIDAYRQIYRFFPAYGELLV
ncbi:MAG TPA: O-methyltransferase [Phycisphaerae bacterium]